MNLLYCGNESVFSGMLISVLSILKYTDKPIHIFILTMDLTKQSVKNKPISAKQSDFLQTVICAKNTESFVKRIDLTGLFVENMQHSVNLENFYTPYCMLRLFADCVSELPDKILYLDTDTVAMDDVNLLYDIDVSGYEFGAAIDYLGKIFKNPWYLNSGVLLLNLKMIRETGLFEKTRNYCNTKKKAFPDQDALNHMAIKKKRIPTRFNCQRRMQKDIVIRHFCKSLRIFPYIHTVNVKPWEIERMHKVLHIHEIDDILKQYRNCIRNFEIGEWKA